jgi:AcrR family transcriptional regulator
MPAGKTKPNQRSRPEREAIERVLAAAEEQLRQEELDLFTIDRVLERAGVSVGTFYRRFSGKNELLHAVQNRLHARMQPAILQALETQEQVGQSLEEAVDHVFGILIEHILRERQLCRAFLMLSTLDPALRQKVREVGVQNRDAVEAVLARHRAEIAHPDPDEAIHHAYHMYLSTMHGRLVFFDPNSSLSGGVSDEAIFNQLKPAISNFLCGNHEANSEA